MIIFTKDQKMAIMKSVLEQLKDAPLLPHEQDKIIEEALYFVDWNDYGLDYSRLSDWGKSIIAQYANKGDEVTKKAVDAS